MPAALVTGATGFVGSHLVDLLLERGWRVSALVRKSSNLRWIEDKPVQRVDPETSPFPDCDVLFHVAGVIRADTYADYLAGNRDLAVRVFEAARAKRFVHVSSLAAAGPGEALDESTPCRPISLYGRSKWEGELAVWARRVRVPVTVIRPPVVYGPRDFGLFDLYVTVAKGLRPEIGAPKRISIVHIRDLVEGIVRAAEQAAGANEVFYLANPEVVEISTVMGMIERSLGKRALKLRIPDRVVRFLGAVVEDAASLAGKRSMFGRDKALEMTQKAWGCSPAKAARLLDWRARVPLAQGMAETVEWYRSQRLL
ncbi:MAG TPA: NAD-dependent epimerase/dehydratase family protein [Planctomycetota bacterium]|nr:NAD-dependent epimerase/dehydratase family protein [Planctomycetota bacterium]